MQRADYMRIRRNTGFTLVEMMVVIAIMLILMSVSAVGIITFQDEARKTKLNNNAELLFNAAQSRLLQMNASGELADWRDTLKDDTGAYVAEDYVPVYSPIKDSGVSTGNSTNYITRSLMSSTKDSTRHSGSVAMLVTDYEIWGDYNEHVLLSLRAKAGDYSKFIADPSSVSDETRMLFELVIGSVQDTEILDGAICLEIAPEDGLVYSAFYSGTASEFYYGKDENTSTGKVDIAKRYYGARLNKLIGYCGVETLTHVTMLPPTGITLGELTFDNGDTLSYHLAMGEEAATIDLSKLQYKISVYDASTSLVALELVCDGGDIQNKDSDLVENLVNCQTIRYNADGTSVNMGTYTLPVYWEKLQGESVNGLGFVLDAADASAATPLIATTSEAYDIREGRDAGGDFAKTLSFFRFGTWAEQSIGEWTDQVYVEVTVSDNGSGTIEASASARSESTSPLFAGATVTEKERSGNRTITHKDISIVNPRHFYNIRYVEDMDLATIGLTNPNTATLNSCVNNFILKNDIDWAAFAKASYYASSTRYNSAKIKNHKMLDADFPSFLMIRETDSITGCNETLADSENLEKDGDGNPIPKENLQISYSVSGVNVSMTNNILYGLYYDYLQAQDKPTGLFLENRGTITYFAVDQSQFVGKNKVGSVCGVNRGTLSYVGTRSTRTDEHPEPTTVRGINYVGGVFGYQGSVGTPDYTMAADRYELYVQHLTNHARVLGTTYVGGITGRVESGMKVQINDTGDDTKDYTKLKLAQILDCENYGQVRGVFEPLAEGETLDKNDAAQVAAAKRKVRYIGGIVGYMSCNQGWQWDKSYGKKYIGTKIERCYNYPTYDVTYDQELLKPENATNYDVKLMDELAKFPAIKHYQIEESANSDLKAALEELNIGYYVGGIVGYSKDVQVGAVGNRLKKENTVSTYVDAYEQELTAPAYIFGDRYVGGIIGFNAGFTTDNLYNYVTVCGNDYVGGIAGVSCMDKTEVGVSDAMIIPDLDTTPDLFRNTCIGATNHGRVFAMGDYVGGVCGLANVDLRWATCQTFNTHGVIVSGRNYVGGLTGRYPNTENGKLGTENYTVNIDVDGENFVGGLVGYIGPRDQGLDTKLTYQRGTVYANGCFAGGLVGASLNPDFYTVERKSNAGSVCARYFAGGFVGGMIVTPTGDMTPRFRVENADMKLYGTAFVGTAMGYHALSSLSGDALETQVQKLANLEDNTLVYNGVLHSLQAKVREMAEYDAAKSLGSVDYATLMNNNNLKYCRASSIEPLTGTGYEGDLVYASGVVGYNGEETILNFTDINNYNTVRTDTITATSVPVSTTFYDGTSHQVTTQTIPYSYVGSYVGVNTKRSTISNCIGHVSFRTAGTYHGQLCEVNDGTIATGSRNQWVNYQYADTGTRYSYVGYACGRNNGTVEVENLRRWITKGKDVLGSLTAENYGTVRFNNATISDLQVDGDTDGSVAGCLIGRNLGNLEYASGITSLTFNGNSYVRTGDVAGGLIGEQVGPLTIANITNNMTGYTRMGGRANRKISVLAVNGISGGIIGRIIGRDGDITLTNLAYANTKDVDIGGNTAGGIVGTIEVYGSGNVTIASSYALRRIISTSMDAKMGGVFATASNGGGAGLIYVNECYNVQSYKHSDDRDIIPNSAGLVYDGGGITCIDRSASYATKDVSYGVACTGIKSMTNTLDATRMLNFMDAAAIDAAEVFSNNYYIGDHVGNGGNNTAYRTWTPDQALDKPADFDAIFGKTPICLNVYVTNSTNDYYAFHTYTDGTGAEVTDAYRTGMTHEKKGNNPGRMTKINDVTNQNLYLTIHEAFLAYLDQ